MTFQIIYCTNCGNKIVDDANFCIKCGNKINKEYNEYSSNENNYYEEYGEETEQDTGKRVDKIFGSVISDIINKGQELNEIIEESKEEVFSDDDVENRYKRYARDNKKNFEILFDNNLKNKVDVNIDSADEISQALKLSPVRKNKLVNLKNRGYKFKSFSDFSSSLELNNYEIQLIKPYIKNEYFESDQFELNNNKKSDVSSKLDINTADFSEISSIPGITEAMIIKLKYYRSNNKKFQTMDELSNFLKLSKRESDLIKPYLKFDSLNSINTARINFNTISKEELSKINLLSSTDIDKIFLLRNNGITFNSFEELELKAEIHHRTILKLKEQIIIDTNSHNEDKNEKNITFDELDNMIKEENDKKNEIKEEKNKIDLNSDNQETLSKIPCINIIMAKKIIDLREQGNYIKSYDDLQQKLNLKPEQINQIKETTTISKKENKQNRRIMDI